MSEATKSNDPGDETPETPEIQADLTPDPPVPRPRKGPPARLSVVEQVYHQLTEGGGPAVVETRFSRWLETDEQPWRRTAKGEDAAGPEWKPLNLGWLAGGPVGMIVLRNEAVEKDRNIWLAVKTANAPEAFARVRPGESVRFEPAGYTDYLARSPDGPARYTLAAIPG